MKNKYRQSVLQQRQSLSDENHSSLSLKIQGHFLNSFPLQHAGNIALYMPTNQEVSLELLANRTAIQDKISLPVIRPNKQMELIRPKPECKFALNKYNVLEPTEGLAISADAHDLILVPSIGVDKNGFRLGYGGGYYDRFLAQQKGLLDRPLIIGLLFNFQKIDAAFGESHDIKFDRIFTELGEEKF